MTFVTILYLSYIQNVVCKQKSTKPRPRLNPSAWRNPGSSTYYRENQQRSNAYSNTNTRAYYPRRSASNASSIRGKKAYAAAPFIPQTPTYQPPYKNTFNPKYRWTAKEAAFTPFAAIPRMNESTFTRPMNRCEDSTQNTQAPSASLPQKMDNMSLEPRERTNTAPQDRVLPILRDAEDVFKTKGDDDVPKAVIPTPLPPPVPPKNEEQPIVAGYGVKIPENLLEDREGLIVGDQFNIVITEISSPTRFWFHSADYINVVETLMQQIE